MIPAQDTKVVAINADMTEDNTAFTTTVVDTQGYDYAQIIAHFGNVPADVAVLKVQESDAAASGFADVSGLDADGDDNIDGDAAALPTAAGGDNAVVVFELDLRKRKRYLDLSVTAGDGSGTDTEMSGIAILSRAKLAPITVSERGAAEVLRV